MEEEIEVVAFACRGTLLDWTGAIEDLEADYGDPRERTASAASVA
jgi:hypothetical protein